MDFYDQTDRLGSYRSRTAPAADIAAATRPVVDNKLLAEPLRQPLTHQARRDVGRAARRGGMTVRELADGGGGFASKAKEQPHALTHAPGFEGRKRQRSQPSAGLRSERV